MRTAKYLTIINWFLVVIYAASFAVRHIPLNSLLELVELINLIPWITAAIAIRKMPSAWRVNFARVSNIFFILLLIGILGLMQLQGVANIATTSLFLVFGIGPALLNLYVLFFRRSEHATAVLS